MGRSKAARQALEYVLFRASLPWIDRLSPEGVERWAGRIGGCIYRFGRRRREIAVGNILRAGIAADRAGAERIARASFRHFATVAAEAIKAPGFFDRHRWQDYVEWACTEEGRRCLGDRSRGLIMVTGHFGNWEIGGQVLSTLRPVVAVARRMNNPRVEALVLKRRWGGAMQTAPSRGEGSSTLVKALKDGVAVAVLTDQHARLRGVQVPFFGVPASTHTVAARLHLLTGAPILTIFAERTGPMRVRMAVEAPVDVSRTGDRDGDIRSILMAINTRLEEAIRGQPGQYLWAHRRWRD